MRRINSALAIFLMAFLPCHGLMAQSSGNSTTTGAATTNQDPTCPNANLLSSALVTSICWSCIFPVNLGGVTIFSRSNPVPVEAADEVICTCDDAGGIPAFGITMGMWQPAQIMEIVRAPGCAPALGGLSLSLGQAYFRGSTGHATHSGSELTFYHYHKYAFPLMAILQMFTSSYCFGDGYLDFDLVYISEIDPTWNNDELAFFTDPEDALVANPIAAAACIADSAMAAADQVTNALFWCAGSWGLLYPFSGQVGSTEDFAGTTSLLSTRGMAALHRRGLSMQTMGNQALCGGFIQPMFPKDMYRMSMFYPSAESAGTASVPLSSVTGVSASNISANGSQPNTSTSGKTRTMKLVGVHPIGQSSMMWGAWRQYPVSGEDADYIVYRWNDCCMTTN